MILARIIEVLCQRKALLARLFIALLALLVVIDALPMLVDKDHAHTAAERLPGFWALFGFASCVLIIFVSKLLGQLGILRQEDFYND